MKVLWQDLALDPHPRQPRVSACLQNIIYAKFSSDDPIELSDTDPDRVEVHSFLSLNEDTDSDYGDSNLSIAESRQFLLCGIHNC
jgi:hypothetical protein